MTDRTDSAVVSFDGIDSYDAFRARYPTATLTATVTDRHVTVTLHVGVRHFGAAPVARRAGVAWLGQVGAASAEAVRRAETALAKETERSDR